MCGFAGLFDPERRWNGEQLQATAAGMADRVRHRGPDGDGVWADAGDGVAFGFRRLSIIDLSDAGAQPMTSTDGRYVIVYNGEIYNFRALRQTLEAEGVGPWRGHSDTEVLLAALARWGIETALQAINGMFAFVLWDREERRLWLARDRMGEKPLYYGWHQGRFLFASELHALESFPGWNGEIDRDALEHYLRIRCVPGPSTIYRGIQKLAPGHVLTLPADRAEVGFVPEPVPYWDAFAVAGQAASDPFAGPDDEAIARLDTLLEEAVAMRLEADVPLGAFLSGGIDSSAVTAMMQKTAGRTIRTFSIGFSDARFNEAEHARAVAEHLGTDHTELYVNKRRLLDAVARLPRVYDEPFADVSQIPTLLLAELTAEEVTVALSGDGGDELFAGYDRYGRAPRDWAAVRRVPAVVRSMIRGAGALVPEDALDSLGRAVSPARRPARLGAKLRHGLEKWGARDFAALYRRFLAAWPRGHALVAGAKPFGQAEIWEPDRPHGLSDMAFATFLDALGYLPDDLLVKMDRATMAAGMESRAPFLDHRLVQFAWSLPDRMKRRGDEEKWLLKQVLYRHVPRALVDRPKQGFDAPVGDWLRDELRDWAEALLSAGNLKRVGLIDPAPVRDRWAEHLAGGRDHRLSLWPVLMFLAWYDVRH